MFVITMIGNGNRTEWGTIQGVIGRLISIGRARFVSITKSKNLRIGIFITLQSSYYISLQLLKQKRMANNIKRSYQNMELQLNSFKLIFLTNVSNWSWKTCLGKFFSWFWFAKPYWLATFDARFLLVFKCQIWPVRLQEASNRTS